MWGAFITSDSSYHGNNMKNTCGSAHNMSEPKNIANNINQFHT